MPWRVYREENQYCVHKLTDDGERGERVACHDTREDADAHHRALEANVEEQHMSAETDIRETVSDEIITEFRGSVPEVTPRPGVNMAALTEGDDNPFFLTVEVSTVGRVSHNGLMHDNELAGRITEQINSHAAEGIMGHIKESERSTAYPIADVHWLGAARQGNSVWAKGYIPRTATAQREHFRILKATNGRAATSITGPAVREFVDKDQGVWRAKDFQLEQLDLAPYTRAALPPESDFVVTREMLAGETEQETDMTQSKSDLLAELTAAEVPQGVREQIIQEHTQRTGTESQVQELQVQVEQGQTRIQELEAQIQEYQVAEFDQALDAQVAELIDWPVKGEEAQKRVDSLKKTLKRHILAEMGDERDPERIEEIAKQAWQELEPLTETVRSALAGPAAVVRGKVRSDKTRELDTSPEAVNAARGQWGI